MDNLKRVDIKLSIETLAWAASKATKLGISRRQFLSRCVERIYGEEPNIQFVKGKYPLTTDECIEPKLESNE